MSSTSVERVQEPVLVTAVDRGPALSPRAAARPLAGALALAVAVVLAGGWLLWWTFLWAGWIILPGIGSGGGPLPWETGAMGFLPALPVGGLGAALITRKGTAVAARLGFTLVTLDELAAMADEAEMRRGAGRSTGPHQGR